MGQETVIGSGMGGAPGARGASVHRVTRFVMWPDASLSWRGNVLFFVSMCVVSFSIAAGYAWNGYWLILPFAGLEMMILGAAVIIVYRHSQWREIVAVNDDKVLVISGYPDNMMQRGCFRRAWASVSLEKVTRHEHRLWLRSHGRRVAIGGCLTDDDKARLANHLSRTLRSADY